MPMRNFPLPLVWSKEALVADRTESEARSAMRLVEQGTDWYESFYASLRPTVLSALEKTEYLQKLEMSYSSLCENEKEALRFACAPPLSQDNAKMLCSSRMSLYGETSELARSRSIRAMLDLERFSWLVNGKTPSEQEKTKAVDWTTGVYAIQKAQTAGRTEAYHRQEDCVKAALIDAGFIKDISSEEVLLAQDIPPGCFRDEAKVAGQKCDIPCRLHDGRLLLIECKVSNSATNSTKRLIREVCGKAQTWRAHFGTSTVVVAAVLDGVFSLTNLMQAQNEHNVYLFWGFRLDDLCDYVNACRTE